MHTHTNRRHTRHILQPPKTHTTPQPPMTTHRTPTTNQTKTMPNLLEREACQNKSELTRLNNLNNRFVDFLNLVKLETKRSDQLQNDLREQKQKYVQDLRGKNIKIK